MTNHKLTEEISVLKQRIQELEQSAAAHHQADRALNTSPVLIETVLDNLPDSLIVIDPANYTILGANKTFADAYGLDKNAAIGKHCYELTHNRKTPCSPPHDICPLAETLKTGKPATAEHIHYDSTGGKRHVEISTLPIISKGGEIHQIIHSSRDITERKRVEEDLKESEGKFRPLAEQSLIGVAIIQDGVFKYVNAKYAEIHGYTVAELLDGFPFQNLIHPDDRQLAEARIEKRLEHGNKADGSAEFKKVTKNGEIMDVLHFGTVQSFQGKPAMFVLLLDITDRKRMETALQESESKYRSLVSTVDSLYLVDRDGRYLLANDNYLDRFGPLKDTILGKKFDEFHDAEYSIIFSNCLKYVLETGNCYQDVLLGKRSGRYFVRTFSPVKDVSGNLTSVTVVSKDITDRKQAEEALRESEKRYRELCVIDELTQLFNARYFYDQLKMEIGRVDRYDQPLTMLLFDVDNFKGFNDVYGHVEGDQVLSRLGKVVKRCLRQTDSAYRYGGEEFTVLLPMTTREDGAVTAERIRTEFKKEVFSPVPGEDIYLTVSTGLGQYKTYEDLKSFVRRVDQLMYQAKNTGKDRVCSES